MKIIKAHKAEKLDLYRRLVSFFILIFEGFGIRILDNVVDSPIIIWTVLLIALNFRQIIKMPLRAFSTFFLFCAFYLLFTLLKGTEIYGFYFAAWGSAFCVLSNYIHGKNDFLNDLYIFTKICVYYDLLHVVAFFTLKPFLFQTDYAIRPSTIFYIFFYNADKGFGGFPRIQGFCWEPSCWNCLLNLNLASVLLLQKTRKEIILCVAAIVSVFSTTGLMVMLVVFMLYFILFTTKINRNSILVIILLLVIVFPIAKDNFVKKLETGSGATRYGDFYVAEYVIKENPILGGESEHITSNYHIMQYKAKKWGVNGKMIDQYEAVGMTNAFAGLFVDWGIPITLLLFYMMYASPLFPNRKSSLLITVMILVVLMGTPIAKTGFFYMFPLSTLLIKKRRNIIAISNASKFKKDMLQTSLI